MIRPKREDANQRFCVYRFLPPVVIKLKKPGVPARAAHVYTEGQLVEQPAIGLFAELGCNGGPP